MYPSTPPPWPRRRRNVSGQAGTRGPRAERPRRVVLTGGGTGGHLYPAISIARELVKTGGAVPEFIGSRTGLEAEVVLSQGFAFHAVASRKVSRALTPAAALSL